MDLIVLNHNFIKENVVDVYKSVIWTDRYNDSGDFEIYVMMSDKMLQTFQNGNYIQTEVSDHTMIVEDISITTDAENGAFLVVTGKSLESLLERRIVWDQTTFSKNTYIETVVQRLLNDAIISPKISNRKIDNFIYKSTSDVYIQNLRLGGDLQFTGDVLYDAIKKICDIYALGFKITLNDDNQFTFELYSGSDRSYAQDILPYIEFSPNFDNLISSDYKIITSGYKNVTLVAGEGEGADRKRMAINNDLYSGLNRRELYTDARDLSTNIEGGTLTDDQYDEILQNRGIAKLTETQIESNFDAGVDYMQPYKYNKDYFMGDIVEFQNQFGISYRVRIAELIYSESLNGIEQYPTFKILEED